MEVVIIRPSLVYGPGVKGNFLAMMRWVYSGVPLPLRRIHNIRSLVALDNLVSLIVVCVTHAAAANQIFLAADGEDLSTAGLLERVGAIMNRPARLFSVRAGVLERVASTLGSRHVFERLCGSLQVDNSKARDLLDWSSVVGVDEALRRTVDYFLATVRR
jgi:nucleoside-diphosphate-sugar epimerase